MHSAGDRWLDEEAGAVVRPYAVTRGRTRPAGGKLDLIALISAVRDASATELGLGPEHLALLRICRRPTSVADLAADLDLPVGVVRILLGDLRERALISVHNPIPAARLPDRRILQEVVDGLRRL
jgi:Protein of unknown function (DUF742)